MNYRSGCGSDLDNAELATAKEARVVCPQVALTFYQDKIVAGDGVSWTLADT